MTPVFLNKIESLTEVTSAPEADLVLLKLMDEMNCGNFSYNYYSNATKESQHTSHILCTEEIVGWQAHYTTHHYDQIDPIMRRMRNSYLPFGWELENELADVNLKNGRALAAALDFGLRGGFVVPIHAPHGEFANLVMQDVAVLARIKRDPELIYVLQLIAYHYHARISDFIAEKNAASVIHLTEREIECLYFTAKHKSAKEIARILAITPRTVGFHLENTLKKLRAQNKHQAVSRAKQLGLLQSKL